MDKHITVPMHKATAGTLRAVEDVYLTGTVYTAWDAAHTRMDEFLPNGGAWSLVITEQMVLYMVLSHSWAGCALG